MADPQSAKTLAQKKLIFLLSLPWMKIFSWGVFLLMVYAMRSFFTVVFLTFLLSYMACNVVKRFSRESKKWALIRKCVVLGTFAVFGLIAYWSGRFIIPNIVAQGQGVVEIVKSAGLDKNFHTIIPNAYADWQFERYKGSEEYTEKLNKLLSEKALPSKGLKAFLQMAQDLRNEFIDQQAVIVGKELFKAQLKDFESSPTDYPAYNDWVAKVVTVEIFQPNKERYVREFEQEKGEAYLKIIKENRGAKYDKYIETDIVVELCATLSEEDKRVYKDRFKMEWIKKEGRKAFVGSEYDDTREKEFIKFYQSKELPYTYDEFLKREKAQTAEEFLKLASQEELDKWGHQAVEQEFKDELMEGYREEIKKQFADVGLYQTLNDVAGSVLPRAFAWFRSGVGKTLSFGFDLLLSVFLSFVIVWDLPQIRKGMKALSKSRLGKVYQEVAPGLTSFGTLLGRSFQARIGIALVNTALMLVIMLFTPIEKRVFLATIVFLGSFIPVVGVFISAVPILLISFQVSGIMLALKMLGAIVGITIFESLVLDPKIMGEALNLHALLVLIVLTVGGYYFGIWGVLLCVPVAVYIIQEVIMGGEGRQEAQANAVLGATETGGQIEGKAEIKRVAPADEDEASANDETVKVEAVKEKETDSAK